MPLVGHRVRREAVLDGLVPGAAGQGGHRRGVPAVRHPAPPAISPARATPRLGPARRGVGGVRRRAEHGRPRGAGPRAPGRPPAPRAQARISTRSRLMTASNSAGDDRGGVVDQSAVAGQCARRPAGSPARGAASASAAGSRSVVDVCVDPAGQLDRPPRPAARWRRRLAGRGQPVETERPQRLQHAVPGAVARDRLRSSRRRPAGPARCPGRRTGRDRRRRPRRCPGRHRRRTPTRCRNSARSSAVSNW